METKNFQKRIVEFSRKWDKKRKIVANEQGTFNHVVEEVGELAREFVNRESRQDNYSEEKLNDGIIDAMAQLIVLADLRKLDIEEEMIKIIEDSTKKHFS